MLSFMSICLLYFSWSVKPRMTVLQAWTWSGHTRLCETNQPCVDLVWHGSCSYVTVISGHEVTACHKAQHLDDHTLSLNLWILIVTGCCSPQTCITCSKLQSDESANIAQIPYFTFEEWLCADPQCWHSLTCRPWPPATDGITPSKALSCSVPAPGYLGQGQIYATALLLNCTLPLHSSPTATWRVCLWLGGSSHATS